MCRLLRHVSGTEPLEITCIHAEDTFQVTGPQVCSAFIWSLQQDINKNDLHDFFGDHVELFEVTL